MAYAYVGPVDALADELLAAIRDHPANLLNSAMFARDGGALQAAYTRLYCELHDPPEEDAREGSG